MELILQSALLPLTIKIIGDINQVDYSWKIYPLEESLRKLDIQAIFGSLKKIKDWADKTKTRVIINSNILFKIAFYFFCKI